MSKTAQEIPAQGRDDGVVLAQTTPSYRKLQRNYPVSPKHADLTQKREYPVSKTVQEIPAQGWDDGEILAGMTK
ncbi:hypothetical protein GCM10011338_19700 [Alteromonas lipolytica]|uniref:Uncharacterized protein n=1 Tax=Alteromonas lipolytica TaxID=1856405 RepID=A0A1E8FD74_9ALTE|nr:hypothetical protein BFC17_20145 [Alteromonas lipolytica]GGF67567.1 hypothetical protein GCM10011338_19700 [Alteromonas lipolytica]